MDLVVDTDALAEVSRRYGLTEIAVFGSVARGNAAPCRLQSHLSHSGTVASPM